jgi:hypothetical protein
VGARLAPDELVALLDAHTTYVVSGYPYRRRRCINGIAVSETDARMIRRWRAGTIRGVTATSAEGLLKRYRLDGIGLPS